MRPVVVRAPTVSAIKTRKATSTSVVAFDISAHVKGKGRRQFVVVAEDVPVYVIFGSSATITDPVVTTVDGGAEAARPVKIPADTHFPFEFDDTNCFFEARTASGSGYLTVYEA